MDTDLLKDLKPGDKFLSEEGHVFSCIDFREKFVPRENKKYKLFYFVKIGNCLSFDEYDHFDGIDYITYDSYTKKFSWDMYETLISKIK